MKYPVFLFIALLLLGCQPNSSLVGDQSIDQYFERYHEDRLRFFPMDATFSGDSRYNDTFPNSLSEEFKNSISKFYSNYLDGLNDYNREKLTRSQQISYDVLKWECEINLEGLKFPTELMPIDQFWSINLIIGQFAEGSSAQPFKTVKDYENWLERVDDFIVWCKTAQLNMQKGMETGYVLPKSLVKKVIPQMESFASGPAEKHHFYSPINKFPENFSMDDKERLSKQYAQMINEKIIPTFNNLTVFFKDNYSNFARESSGIMALPDGENWYNQRIRYYTTTTMTANEIYELGLKEVARIAGEMEKVKKEVGFDGDLKAFFDHVRSNPELMPYRQPSEVIDNFNAIHEKVKPNLSKLFDLVPKTPFEVRRTESFREVSASAEYNPGSIDGSRPGIFYVPIPEIRSYNIYSDEDLFLHEAIPGHHYQISLQQENEELPKFRKTLWYSAFGEGWALYSESLGEELGLYEDPHQYFGMLGAEIHRAIRLVVDVGIHSKGWTREKAIQYSLDNEAESEASIISEIERYMAGPGQALSYKIGQLKIMELRAKAEIALGDKFDVRQFHNQVLEPGCIPLKVLESKIDQWIAEESGE